MKKFICSLFLSFVLVVVWAQIPEGYYQTAIGKKGAALKTELHNIIKDANVLSYGSGAGSTWSGFAKTDRRPDGTVWDMYSNEVRQFNGNSAPGGMNIEHSFAKSWWGGGKNQAYKDLFHLNPSDSRANSARGSWPLGVVTGKETYNNGVIKVGKSNLRPGGEITVWEPADEYKGDFARAYMYMVTCYEHFANQWTGNSEPQLDNNTYPVFEDWTIQLFLEWTRQDPVSEKEMTRNREIYKIQGNRNPYIDFSNMAEYVWGQLKDVPFTEDGNVDFPYISEPHSGSTVDFGKQAYLQSVVRTIRVKAANLTDDLTVAITGTDAGLFTASQRIARADAEAGYDLQVVFTASEVGEKTATLTLSGGGVSGVSVALKALSTDDFVALPATGVTATGFTANWTVSAGATGYALDVYSLQSTGETQSEIVLESDFMQDLPNGWTKGDGYAQKQSGEASFRLASSSQGGSIAASVDLNGVAATITVNAKQYNNDNSVLTLTADGNTLETWTMTADYADYTAELPAGETLSIGLSAETKKRVYLASVRIETQGDKPEKVSVNGYPVDLPANVLSQAVTGLHPDSTYYYTVAPAGNEEVMSAPIEVQTGDEDSGVENVPNRPTVHWFVTGSVMHMSNVPAGTLVQVFDITGTPVYTAPAASAEMQVTLPARGMYLLRVGEQVHRVMNK